MKISAIHFKNSHLLIRVLGRRCVFAGLSYLFFLPPVMAQDFALKGGERLRIQGARLHVELQVRESSQNLRVQLNESASEVLQVRSENGLIWVQPRDQSREALGASMGAANAGSKLSLTIQGPALPAEIFLEDGSVSVERWTQALIINAKTLQATLKNLKGSLRVHTQKGNIQVSDFTGSAEIDVYQAQIGVRQSSGDLTIKSFNGETTVEKYNGVIQLHQSQNQARIRDSSGTLRYQVHRGQLTTQLFAGRIEGGLLEGQVQLGIAAETEVNVQAKAGRVTVVPPEGSGAQLNLLTGDGEITAPPYLRIQRGAHEKTLNGRLRGSLPGSIRVRAEEALIQVR